MNEKLRAALDTIDSLLIDPEIGHALWYVLSALRGPDAQTSEGVAQKLAATIPIRRTALPQVTGAMFHTGKPNSFIYNFPASFGIGTEKFKAEAVCGDHGILRYDDWKREHFELHVLNAARALGLVEDK